MGLLVLQPYVYANDSDNSTQIEVQNNTELSNENEDLANTEENTEDPGLTPDDTLYFLDLLLEKIQLAIAADDVAKAKLLASLTQERIAEMNYLVELSSSTETNVDEEILQRVKDNYKEKLELMLEKIDEIAEKSEEESKKILEELAVNLESISTIQADIINHDEDLEASIEKAIFTAKVIRNFNQEQVAELRDKELGFGQIAQIYALAEATGMEINATADLYIAHEMEIGEVSKLLGVHPADLIKKSKGKVKNEQKEQQEKNGQVNQQVKSDMKHVHIEVKDTINSVKEQFFKQKEDSKETTRVNREAKTKGELKIPLFDSKAKEKKH